MFRPGFMLINIVYLHDRQLVIIHEVRKNS